jgi:hypothetical protein
MIQQVYEGLDWLGTVASGLAVIGAAWGMMRFIPLPGRPLLGRWYGYCYIYSQSGMTFFREDVVIQRGKIRPWHLLQKTTPAGSDSTVYRGPVYYRDPYVFTAAVDSDTGDRTFDIGRLHMDSTTNKYSMIVALHLGNSFEGSVDCASAYLWVRERLDPLTNDALPANEREESLFRDIVSQFVKVDKDHLQLQLVPPLAARARGTRKRGEASQRVRPTVPGPGKGRKRAMT